MAGMFLRIKKGFYSLPVRDKVFYLMVFLLTLTIIVFLLSINSIIRNRLIAKTTVTANQNLAMISEKLNMFKERVQSDSILIVASDQCQKVLSMVADEPVSMYQRNKLIQSTMMSVFVSDAIYKSIVYYDTSGNYYLHDRIIVNDKYIPAHKEKITEFIQSNKGDAWLSLHKSPYSERKGNESDCLSYLRKVYEKDSGKLIGVMETEIESSKILSLYSTLLNGEMDVVIIDEGGRILSSQFADKLYTDISGEDWYQYLRSYKGESFRSKDAQFFYFLLEYSKLNWTIMAKVPTDIFLKDVQLYTLVTIIIGVLLLLITSIISRVLAHTITSPIKKITETVKTIAGGDYNQRVKVETTDEIGVLSTEFNRMIDTTNELMSRIVKEEKEKRDYALSLMQLQMTPHFLYNILESICGLIVIDEKKTAIRTINLLSNFYRGVLSKGRDIVTIEDEIILSRYYLEVLEICHPGVFNYHIDIDPQINKCLINKLTLQPILENAIHHGIIGSGRSGIIEIKGFRDGDKAVILVTDNGQGMTAQTLERIQAGVAKEHRMDSFGFKNTDDRIKLYFGSEYGISISSVYLEGSAVRIELPAGEKVAGIV